MFHGREDSKSRSNANSVYLSAYSRMRAAMKAFPRWSPAVATRRCLSARIVYYASQSWMCWLAAQEKEMWTQSRLWTALPNQTSFTSHQTLYFSRKKNYLASGQAFRLFTRFLLESRSHEISVANAKFGGIRENMNNNDGRPENIRPPDMSTVSSFFCSCWMWGQYLSSGSSFGFPLDFLPAAHIKLQFVTQSILLLTLYSLTGILAIHL